MEKADLTKINQSFNPKQFTVFGHLKPCIKKAVDSILPPKIVLKYLNKWYNICI